MARFGRKKGAPPSLRAQADAQPLDETMIVVDDVHQRWVQDDGEVRGLHGISFSVRAGEFVFITGPTGHGKTTALRLLRGQSTADKGQVLFGGKPVGAYNPRLYKRSVALVSQDFDILPLQTVAENIAMPLQYLRYHPDDIAERVDSLLKVFSLEHKRGSLAGKKLSGGERQRLAIARAIAHEPDVLLCDEPTGNLDPRTTYGVLRILNRIAMGGTTVICVTHDQHVVDLMGKRTIVIDSGRIVADRIASPRLDLAVDAARDAEAPAAVLPTHTHDDALLDGAEVTEAQSPAPDEGLVLPGVFAGGGIEVHEPSARRRFRRTSEEDLS